MTSAATRLLRRLRYGRPIIVVSGLPRSGTSMAMRMLQAGGVPLLTDGIRAADVDNPEGYFEFEPVKDLENGRQTAWLADARGKAVKIVSFLLTWLPETHDYKVIFMERDLDEVLASQATMIVRRGGTPGAAREDEGTRRAYQQHLEGVSRFLSRRRCFSRLTIPYRDVLADPHAQAQRMRDFLDVSLDSAAMARAVDPALYRNRR